MGNFVKFALGGIFTMFGLACWGYGITVGEEKVKTDKAMAWLQGFEAGTNCQKIVDKYSNPIEEAPKKEED